MNSTRSVTFVGALLFHFTLYRISHTDIELSKLQCFALAVFITVDTVVHWGMVCSLSDLSVDFGRTSQTLFTISVRIVYTDCLSTNKKVAVSEAFGEILVFDLQGY